MRNVSKFNGTCQLGTMTLKTTASIMSAPWIGTGATMQLPAYSDAEKETELDAARAAVAANTNLFMELNEEEFAKYLQTFVQDVWVLLTKVTLDVRQVRNTRHPSLTLSAQ